MKEHPKEFSDLCKDLYWFMYGLDRNGLNWDYQETMDALEPVNALEADNAAFKEQLDHEKMCMASCLDDNKKWHGKYEDAQNKVEVFITEKAALQQQVEGLKEILKRASRFNELSIIESSPAWEPKGTFQQEIDKALEGSDHG